jgi:hypothetical protein
MGVRTGARKAVGIFKKKAVSTDPDVRVADFSYQNDALAEMIAKAWTDTGTFKFRQNRARETGDQSDAPRCAHGS